MFAENPSVIQDGRKNPRHPGTTASVPLVLVHDGGGTTYSYYLLDELGRVMMGIANPRFEAGPPWVGGLHEMAALYADLLVSSVRCGPVILGGWSLGGMLALEMAYVLSEKYPAIHVVGLVMIDSVCPMAPSGGWGEAESRLVERRIEWPVTTKAATRAAVQRCFDEAHKMAREWEPPPTWAFVASQPSQGREADGSCDEVANTPAATRPPPVVLLRSLSPVPVPEGGLLFVDLYRHERHLGWDNYRQDLFCRVIDIPGNHYTVFSMDHLGTVSDMIKLACQTIEDLSSLK
ncbi:thioesterase [Grosmannia clavigera kw1407]|uniref:Thioesterase n=1 Tax=Grosmannia clavigera (strain kw1407 / UAMH 11150) TaxID=655863 RepID=F0XP02_GROCL|nr:thioesterase [Grosmannia clavigera kw1407]EFX00411.1 thioesterase [Grosmannia clavigera kw1407]